MNLIFVSCFSEDEELSKIIGNGTRFEAASSPPSIQGDAILSSKWSLRVPSKGWWPNCWRISMSPSDLRKHLNTGKFPFRCNISGILKNIGWGGLWLERQTVQLTGCSYAELRPVEVHEQTATSYVWGFLFPSVKANPADQNTEKLIEPQGARDIYIWNLNVQLERSETVPNRVGQAVILIHSFAWGPFNSQTFVYDTVWRDSLKQLLETTWTVQGFITPTASRWRDRISKRCPVYWKFAKANVLQRMRDNLTKIRTPATFGGTGV